MREIVFNNNSLNISDIDEKVVRTKAIIVNSKDEIMLGYSNNTYQFPGGHLKDGETLEECLLREIKEETGIELESGLEEPIAVIRDFKKDYPKVGKNRQNEIYYYVVKTDMDVDLDNTDYDFFERLGNFQIKKFPLTSVEEVLISSIDDNQINKFIVAEMLEILKEYKSQIAI